MNKINYFKRQYQFVNSQDLYYSLSVNLLNTVQSEIDKRKLLKKGETLILGISGGVDSCVLLDILLKMNQYEIVLAHINHGLRQTARRDEVWVRTLASRHGLKIEVLSCDIKKLSKKRKESLETCGRFSRYRFFKETAVKYGAYNIVTAHTADDQIETLVMNYMRGALERGLRGIAWRRQLELDSQFYVARPLLSIWKKDIYEYAILNKIKFHEDESNWDGTFLRNKIRHEVVAKLGFVVKQEMWCTAEKYRAQEYKREQKAIKIFKKNVRIKKDKLFLQSKDLLTLDQEIQHRLIEKMCQHVLRRGDFLLLSEKFNSIEKVLHSSKPHAMLEVQIGLFLHKQYDEICVTDHDLFVQKNFSYGWDLKKPVEILETGQILRVEVGSPKINRCREEPERRRGDPIAVAMRLLRFTRKDGIKNIVSTTAHLDAEKVGKKVIVRNRREGDKIKPLGMKNYKKIKKILIDSKIPLETRQSLPIVESEDGNIIWVAGLCISDDYKIGKMTKKILKIDYCRP